MPLSDGYGVVIGTFHDFYRDDPDDYGNYYHGTIELNVYDTIYRCPVDVDSHQDQIHIEYRFLQIDRRKFSRISRRPIGFYSLASNQFSGAIDYIRSKFLLPKRDFGRFWRYIAHFFPWLLTLQIPNNESLWTPASGDEALDVLQDALSMGVTKRIFIFGEPFTSGNGMHNIHQNQGDPVDSPWSAENGIWQDGATFIEKEDGKIYAFLNKFSSQAYQTNNQGKPLA